MLSKEKEKNCGNADEINMEATMESLELRMAIYQKLGRNKKKSEYVWFRDSNPKNLALSNIMVFRTKDDYVAYTSLNCRQTDATQEGVIYFPVGADGSYVCDCGGPKDLGTYLCYTCLRENRDALHNNYVKRGHIVAEDTKDKERVIEETMKPMKVKQDNKEVSSSGAWLNIDVLINALNICKGDILETGKYLGLRPTKVKNSLYHRDLICSEKLLKKVFSMGKLNLGYLRSAECCIDFRRKTFKDDKYTVIYAGKHSASYYKGKLVYAIDLGNSKGVCTEDNYVPNLVLKEHLNLSDAQISKLCLQYRDMDKTNYSMDNIIPFRNKADVKRYNQGGVPIKMADGTYTCVLRSEHIDDMQEYDRCECGNIKDSSMDKCEDCRQKIANDRVADEEYFARKKREEDELFASAIRGVHGISDMARKTMPVGKQLELNLKDPNVEEMPIPSSPPQLGNRPFPKKKNSVVGQSEVAKPKPLKQPREVLGTIEPVVMMESVSPVEDETEERVEVIIDEPSVLEEKVESVKEEKQEKGKVSSNDVLDAFMGYVAGMENKAEQLDNIIAALANFKKVIGEDNAKADGN